MKAINVKIEHLVNPIGIDVKNPLVTWNCETDFDGESRQSAYEVVAVVESKQVYSSGKVFSDKMHDRVGYLANSRERVEIIIRLWNENDEVSVSDTFFYEMGLIDESDFKAKWIMPNEGYKGKIEDMPHMPANYFKKEFSIETLSKNARLYISSLGLYEAYINGERVGDFVLAPGSYNYDEHVAYQTYDVSSYVREGINEVEVILGDGWYRSTSGVDGKRNIYGDKTAIYFQLELGGDVICVSDETWTSANDGPIRFNDMQQGEVIDARMNCKDYKPVILDNVKHRLIASNALPICEMERFTGKIKKANGGYLVDFSQNIAGYLEFDVKATEGDTFKIQLGESLDANGEFTQENFQDRKRHKEGGTRQEVIYTATDGKNHYKSKFMIAGFRYGFITGDVDIDSLSITAIAVYSKMDTLVDFKCSNEMLNQLFSNCIWSMKSNFCDVPTDCPTRERAAWTGDMGVFADVGLYLCDSITIMKKWLKECRLAQYKDGRIANIAPRNNTKSFFSGLLAGSVGWGDASLIVPYTIYKHTNDVSILEENYDMMRKWCDYLSSRARKAPKSIKEIFNRHPLKNYTINTGIDYGEWCEPDIESQSAMRTPQPKVATAYYAYSTRLFSEIAGILGYDEDREKYFSISEKAKLAYREIATVNEEDELNKGSSFARIISDRQAEYVRAIMFDLLTDDEKKQAACDLNALVVKNGYHLNTGFLSTPDLCRVLSDYGYVETAYKVLLNEDMPGWLYSVKNGATTIWEVWDGIDSEGNPKESLNHYSKGAVAGFLIKDVCGISVENEKIIIDPKPCKLLENASCRIMTELGEVSMSWEYIGTEVRYDYSLPANVSCEVRI